MTEPSNSPLNLQRRYWCFISYKHTDNKDEGRQWASWLHQQLETYEVPEDLVGKTNQDGEEIPSRIFPVFRDEEELGAGSDLSERIYAALDNTKVLVVLCSPRVIESSYVFEEIRHFKRIGKSDFIYAAIIDGEPGSRVIESGKCFPDSLQFEVDQQGQLLEDQPAETLAADFRLPDGTQGWTSPEAYRQALADVDGRSSRKKIDQMIAAYSDRLDLAKLKLISGILKVPLGVLQKRDKAYQLELAQKRARRLRRWLAAVTLLTILAVIGGIVAMIQRDQTQQALSNNFLDQGLDLIGRDRHGEGLGYLAASLETRKKNRPAADRIFLELARGNSLVPVRRLPPPPPGTHAFLPQDLKALEGFRYNEMRRYPLSRFSTKFDGVEFFLPIRKEGDASYEFSHTESYTCRFGPHGSWTKIGKANTPPWDGYSTGGGRLISVPEGEAGPDYGFLHIKDPDSTLEFTWINPGASEPVAAMGLAAVSPDRRWIGLHGHLLNYRGNLDWDLPTQSPTIHLIDRVRKNAKSDLTRYLYPKTSPDLADNETLTAVRFVGPYFVSHFSNFERRGWRTEIVDCSNPNDPILVSDSHLLPGLIDDYNEATQEFLVRTREGLITYRLTSGTLIDYGENGNPVPEITGVERETGPDDSKTLVVRSSDGKWTAEATAAGIIRILDSQKKAPLRTFSIQLNPTVEGGYFIERMLFLPNSPYLLFSLGVQSDHSFAWCVWDFHRGKKVFASSSEMIIGTDRLVGASSDGEHLVFDDVRNTPPRRGQLQLFGDDSSISPLLITLAELAAGLELVEGGFEPLDMEALFQRRASILANPETDSPDFEQWLQSIGEAMKEQLNSPTAKPPENKELSNPISEIPPGQPVEVIPPEPIESGTPIPVFPPEPAPR